jgi:inosine-uridine nucleoside N-ribohydrolase
MRDMRHWSMESAQIGDAGAVVAALRPDAVTVRRMNVAVETRGLHSRGMTVCDPRAFSTEPDRPIGPANASVCVDVDAAAIKRAFAETVLTSA